MEGIAPPARQIGRVAPQAVEVPGGGQVGCRTGCGVARMLGSRMGSQLLVSLQNCALVPMALICKPICRRQRGRMVTVTRQGAVCAALATQAGRALLRESRGI